ncbi:ABC transporter permease [Paenibacillus sp. sgz500958]|uniref:ABC transporter permease n=1 Tax=Paenibacillus sp. sgz500958 TaxID=3242475 RepID=UPI0036D24899
MLYTVNSSTDTLSLALASIAGISQFVGGIGIMNIIIVSVNERTREIGVREAIGPKKFDILTHFIIESLVLSGLGGIIGVGIGVGGSWLLGKYSPHTVSIAWDIVFVSFIFSLLIGIIFGMMPPNIAARLRPIYALSND